MGDADELTTRAFARAVSRLIPIAGALVAVAFLMFSVAGYERIKSYMDSLSFDGDAFTFSRALFTTLVRAARLAAAVLMLAAAILFRSRQRVEHILARFAANTLEYVRRTAGAIGLTIRHETAAHLAAVLAVIALGIALRVRALWQPINYDEAFTYIVYANRPWLIAWANYSEPNNHLLHTLLAHLSIGLFGNAVWAIRLPALLAGIVTIPLAYATARRLAGRNEAVLVSALTATAQVMVAFSVCARGYSMIVDLFLLAVLCGLDIITMRSAQPWPIFVMCCVLGVFTIPVFLYPYGGLLIWLFLAGRRDPENAALRASALARSAAWTVGLMAVCYAPAIATSGLRAGIDYSHGPVSTLAFITTLWRPLQAVWLDLMRGLPVGVMIAMVLSAVLGVSRLWRTTGGVMLIGPLLFVPALTIPVQRTLAPARVWTYLLPIFFVYGAAGAMTAAHWIAARVLRPGRMMSRLVPSAAAATLALAISVHAATHLPVQYTEWNDTNEIYAHTDLNEVAGYLKTSLAERDALVVGPLLDFPLEYYLRIHGVPIAFLRRPPSNPERVIVLANDWVRQPIATVLTMRGFDPHETKPRLVRRFTYSSLYEVQPQRREQ